MGPLRKRSLSLSFCTILRSPVTTWPHGALKAGILSQTKAPGLSYRQRISLSFYHKSIQEFIAALYITCEDADAVASFRSNCDTIDKVLELSNMIKFVCGLDPTIGSQMSEYVNEIARSDTDIIHYRTKALMAGRFYGNHHGKKKVKEMYMTQLEWQNEMIHNLSYTQSTDPTPKVHVSDIYLDSCTGGLNVAYELLCIEDVVSVHLSDPTDVRLVQRLKMSERLTTLHIDKIYDTYAIEQLARLLHQLVNLQYVRYSCIYGSTSVVAATGQLPMLKSMELLHITLTSTVALAQQLDTLVLCDVDQAFFILTSLRQCSTLRDLQLIDITLTDNVMLPTSLENVTLHKVYSARYLVTSLPGCVNQVTLNISLCDDLINLISNDSNSHGELKPGILASILPQLMHLQHISYHSFWFSELADDIAVVCALQHLGYIKHIELHCINLGYAGTVLVTPNMAHLQKLELHSVWMAARRWSEFLSSLLSVQRTIHVTLKDTDIAEDIVMTIRNSPQCVVSHYSDNSRKWGYRNINMTFSTIL